MLRPSASNVEPLLEPVRGVSLIRKRHALILLTMVAAVVFLSGCVSSQKGFATGTGKQVGQDQKEPRQLRSAVWDQEQSEVVRFRNGILAPVKISNCNPTKAQTVTVAWPTSRHQKDQYDKQLLVSLIAEARTQAVRLCHDVTGQSVKAIDSIRVVDGTQSREALVSFRVRLLTYAVIPSLSNWHPVPRLP